MYHLNGFDIVVQPPSRVKTKRLWKERLFSLPFRPFTYYKTELVDVLENGQVIKLEDKLVMNSTTHGMLVKAINKTC